MSELSKLGIAPRIIILENVCGVFTSHSGGDFRAIFKRMSEIGYRVGALVADAAQFLPQSRPRLFFVCVRDDVRVPNALKADGPNEPWHPRALRDAYAGLSLKKADEWIWWNLPKPKVKRKNLAHVLELDDDGSDWHTKDETRQLLSMMSTVHLKKLADAKSAGRRVVGTMFRRTRYELGRGKVQRAEVRFDGTAGCLRTPAGGSSRQIVVFVEGRTVRTRLMRPRETARLMGLSDSYKLPTNFNDALHLTGDGVAVPVVKHLNEHLFEPILIPSQLGFEFAA